VKGQMMLITSVVVSLILLATGSAIAGLGDREYQYRDEGYMMEMVKDEAQQVDTRFRKNRENFRKMVESIDSYTTTAVYWEREDCFNVTMNGRESDLYMRCIG
jgi:hypothetical protein